MNSEESDLLTIPEAASFLRLQPATIRAWVLKRKLMYVKLGGRVFLRRGDLQDLLERSLVPAVDAQDSAELAGTPLPLARELSPSAVHMSKGGLTAMATALTAVKLDLAELHDTLENVLKAILQTETSGKRTAAETVDMLINTAVLQHGKQAGIIQPTTDAESAAFRERATAALQDCERLGLPPDETQRRFEEIVKEHCKITEAQSQALDEYEQANEQELAKAILRCGVIQAFERRGAANLRESVPMRAGRPHSIKSHFNGCLRQVVGYLDLLANNDRERFVFPSLKSIRQHARHRRGKAADHIYDRASIYRALLTLSFLGVLQRATRRRTGVEREGWIVADHEAVTHLEDGNCVFHASMIADELRRRAGIGTGSQVGSDATSEERPTHTRCNAQCNDDATHDATAMQHLMQHHGKCDAAHGATQVTTLDPIEEFLEGIGDRKLREELTAAPDPVAITTSETVSDELTLGAHGTLGAREPREPVETRERVEPDRLAVKSTTTPHSLSSSESCAAGAADGQGRGCPESERPRLSASLNTDLEWLEEEIADLPNNAGFPMTTKVRAIVRKALVAGRAKEKIKLAVWKVLEKMPDTEKQPGLFLQQNLDIYIRLIDRWEREQEVTQRLMDRRQKEMEAEAAAEGEALRIAELEQEALVEDELGG